MTFPSRTWLARPLLATALCCLMLPLASFAEEEDPAFMRHLFAPEFVLEQSREIELTRDQRREMLRAIKTTQLKATELETSVLEAALDLEELAEEEPIDEDKMVAAAKKIFLAEGGIKEEYLRLMVQIRNLLTPAQRDELRKIRGD